MKLKLLTIAVAAGISATTLTGCMGQMALTNKVVEINLKAVDNRYGREGLFLLLSPVWGIANLVDLFVINAIEFWTGTNPVTGKSPAVVDTPVDAWMKVNDSLGDSVTDAPLSSINVEDVKSATMQQLDDKTLQMNIQYKDGTEKTLRGVKGDDSVAFYLDEKYITTVSSAELQSYAIATRG
ncbi:DUF3332 domain-containing protein [Pseudomaricurvus sp. HS19]|uniref:DUF3332 domain-containing protein n=1 Tax=Pseudomaricurvus sp. HS19 TaxID=2692626 RepID=UPI00136D4E4B|nr:DUF3332 domain-containing protein [Pseudomaricurvus sp. HS19]MYM64301.1 DUF3332 family protein [Pseudomaricurvus sp. HS19]